MYKQETIKPYNKDGEKTEQVEQMFNKIAPSYDTLNHRLSFNIDKLWRKNAVKKLAEQKPKMILDIATGTGDLAIQLAKYIKPTSVIAVDISEEMMKEGQKKVEKENLSNIISFQKEDCLNLSFNENSFDAVTAAFGIRNFQDLKQGLKEIYRVLKPGGSISIIELTTPISFPMKQCFKLYSHSFLPIYGRVISKDKSAYSYLTKTIEAFPQGEKMQEILQNIGFKHAEYKRLTFGICTMYFAIK